MVGEGGEGVVGHVGLHMLGRFADSMGVTGALSDVFDGRGWFMIGAGCCVIGVLMLTGGRQACSDIECLRAQPGLFGPVASYSTLFSDDARHRRTGPSGVGRCCEPGAETNIGKGRRLPTEPRS